MTKTKTIQVRVDDDDVAKLDDLRRVYADLEPTRSAIVRVLIRRAHAELLGEQAA